MVVWSFEEEVVLVLLAESSVEGVGLVELSVG